MEKIEISKRGIPCMWEKGGSGSNIGRATIITNKSGEPKRPLHIRKKGELSCGEHALIPVEAGDFVIFAGHQRDETMIKIQKIENVSVVPGEVPGEVIDEIYHKNAEDVFQEKYGLTYEELEPTNIDTKRPCKKMGKLIVYHQFSNWFQICKIEKTQFAYAEVKLLERVEAGRSEVEGKVPQQYRFLRNGIHKAVAKAFCYHCSYPFYVQMDFVRRG